MPLGARCSVWDLAEWKVHYQCENPEGEHWGGGEKSERSPMAPCSYPSSLIFSIVQKSQRFSKKTMSFSSIFSAILNFKVRLDLQFVNLMQFKYKGS